MTGGELMDKNTFKIFDYVKENQGRFTFEHNPTVVPKKNGKVYAKHGTDIPKRRSTLCYFVV